MRIDFIIMKLDELTAETGDDSIKHDTGINYPFYVDAITNSQEGICLKKITKFPRAYN